MDFSRILYSEISFKPASVKTHHISHNYTNGLHLNGGGSNGESISSPSSSSSVATASSNNSSNSSFKMTIKNQAVIIHHNNNDKINNLNNHQEEFQQPRHQLCDPSTIKLDWLQTEKIGVGLINVGNTCFLNSVLQCLTYCPPLYNFLVKLNGGHSSSCKISQFCMLCEMEKHVKRIKNPSGTPVKPISIVQRLKYINKSFQFGRQEDAHEFLRYLIDHMWKACLMNLDICNKTQSKLDPRIKETTIINHIFGGYHRSQVLCLTCNSRSNTFDFFMDLILDIRNAKSIEEALKRFTQSETLENENAYKCSQCRKKVSARKKFTVHKAPNVATFQLKRFDSDRIFGGKVTKFISYPEELNLRPFMSDPTKSPIRYQLSAVLVHVGHSSNSGHYFCFIKNSNNFWYRMDDSNVQMVPPATVLSQQAYVLFYTRKSSDQQKYPSNGTVKDIKSSSNLTAATKIAAASDNIANNKTTTPIRSTDTSILSISTPKVTPNSTNHSITSHSSTNKITSYFTPSKKNSSHTQPHTSPPKNQNSVTSVKTGDTNSTQASFATWGGSRSKLDEEESNKRKLNESTDRDKFNEELDQGKVKKIKSHSRDDRFSNLSKTNPFQRFTSNGYQQYNNTRDSNSFQKHNGRQYNKDNNSNGFSKHCHHKSNNKFRPHHDHHKNRFRHNGRHKGRSNFNRR